MDDVVFLVEGKVQGIQNGGRIDVIIVVILRINECVPGVVDGGQQNVGLHQGVKDVHERKEGRNVLGAKRQPHEVVQAAPHAAQGPVGLSFLLELEDAGNVQRVQKPNVHVSQVLLEGIPWVGPRRVDIVNVIVVFVVVVNVGFRKGTGNDSVKETDKVIVDILESQIFSKGHVKELPVRVGLLVTQDVDVHEISVHGPDADHIVERRPPPDESVASRKGLRLGVGLGKEIRGKANGQPKCRVDNERILGMDHQTLVESNVGSAPLVELGGLVGQLEGQLIEAFPERAANNLGHHEGEGRKEKGTTHKEFQPSRKRVGLTFGTHGSNGVTAFGLGGLLAGAVVLAASGVGAGGGIAVLLGVVLAAGSSRTSTLETRREGRLDLRVVVHRVAPAAHVRVGRGAGGVRLFLHCRVNGIFCLGCAHVDEG